MPGLPMVRSMVLTYHSSPLPVISPVSQGAAPTHRVQALAGWETGLTCSQQGSLGGPGMGFSLSLVCPVNCSVGKDVWVFSEGLPWPSLHSYVPEVTEEEKTKEEKQEAKG